MLDVSNSPTSLDIRFILVTAEKKFRLACEQIVLLNHRLVELQDRYESAKRENQKCFRYCIRLKLAVVEGVRNMYHDYARWQAVQVSKLREEIYGTSDNDFSTSDEDEDDLMDVDLV